MKGGRQIYFSSAPHQGRPHKEAITPDGSRVMRQRRRSVCWVNTTPADILSLRNILSYRTLGRNWDQKGLWVRQEKYWARPSSYEVTGRTFLASYTSPRGAGVPRSHVLERIRSLLSLYSSQKFHKYLILLGSQHMRFDMCVCVLFFFFNPMVQVSLIYFFQEPLLLLTYSPLKWRIYNWVSW
jgi:hypothetical protein